MNKWILTIPLAVTLIVGCEGRQQDQNATLYDAHIEIDASDSSENTFSGSVKVGPEDKRVPIHITWSTKADSTGCLRISQVKVSRQGGDPGTVITEVKHSAIPDCGMKWESVDTTRYQTAIIQLRYESTKLLKTYTFSGSVASILGNGEFSPM